MTNFQRMLALGLLIALKAPAFGESGKQQDSTMLEKPMLCLTHKEELTFATFSRIPELAGLHLPRMQKALKESGFERNGPNVFHYEFADDPHGPDIPDGKFSLTIAIPIKGKGKENKDYKTAELPEFRYVSIVERGFEWQKARENAEQKSLKRSLIEREVYHKWRGPGNQENRIEHQVGVE